MSPLSLHDALPISEADSTTIFTLEFPSGATAEGMTSFVKSGNKLEVVCEEGEYGLEPMSTYTGVGGSTSDGRLLNKPIANQQAAQMDNDALAIIHDRDRKSTRLNSSHVAISYAVFCLKKKKK